MKSFLKDNGIGTGFGVLEGLHQLVNINSKLKNTDLYLDTILSLPIYPNLTIEEVQYISKIIQNFIKENNG